MARRGIDWIDAAAAGLLLTAAGTVAYAEGGGAKLASNETAAIATLRNMAVCQAQFQTTGKVDCDADGIGEYGTFLEMTGSTGVRKGLVAPKGKPGEKDFAVMGSNFKKQGTALNPPIVAASLANVDANGFVAKNGYAFVIFLPDTSAPAAYVHETGPAAKVGLAGGTGCVGIDLSETTWCLYAQPIVRGETGNRRFFTNQAFNVFQSANDVAKAQGTAKVIEGNSAFRKGAGGITAQVAVGTVGCDGDVWKVTN